MPNLYSSRTLNGKLSRIKTIRQLSVPCLLLEILWLTYSEQQTTLLNCIIDLILNLEGFLPIREQNEQILESMNKCDIDVNRHHTLWHFSFSLSLQLVLILLFLPLFVFPFPKLLFPRAPHLPRFSSQLLPGSHLLHLDFTGLLLWHLCYPFFFECVWECEWPRRREDHGVSSSLKARD